MTNSNLFLQEYFVKMCIKIQNIWAFHFTRLFTIGHTYL